jgi:hypothetical protein
MRELVPSATATLKLLDGRSVTLASVLPLAWPALHRADGTLMLGLQTQTGSGDLSRDLGDALVRAIESEPGTPVPPAGLPEDGPRLQDLLDLTAPFELTVHDDFDFWVEGVADTEGDVAGSLAQAKEGMIPTVRLTNVESAYWCNVGTKEHLRWVLDRDEERALDALARMHADGQINLADQMRFVGSFRALGLIIPVWDLPVGTGAQALEPLVEPWLANFEAAFESTEPLSSQARRARAGLTNRQVTLN